MIVSIPSPLRSYTDDASKVEAEGATLGDVLGDLDRRYPGLRFRVVDETARVRRHIKLFVNELVVEDLGHALRPGDRVHIVAALSGG